MVEYSKNFLFQDLNFCVCPNNVNLVKKAVNNSCNISHIEEKCLHSQLEIHKLNLLFIRYYAVRHKMCILSY